MNVNLVPQRARSRSVWRIVGWFLLVGLGSGLTWYGFTWTEEGGQIADTPSSGAALALSAQKTVWPTATPLASPMATGTPAPTGKPSPTATPEPTALPPTLTPATPYIVAGADGVNVRSGPGLAYTRLGYLEPGAQAALTGRDGDWWQILYDGAPGWVFGPLVTAYHADQVAPLPTTPPTPTEPRPADTDVATWPAEVFRLINQVRAENGIPPYTYDETLERAAELHGQDCQQRGSCNHTGSDGSNVRTRIERAGYDAAGSAEVLVYAASPQQAVDWWMGETPPDDLHRRTLLSTWVTEAGVAAVPTGRGNYYFIVDFGRPRTP